MIVLTAIGAFFKKIWDWIKQTAWVQPLLIVGIIFGVIFSIPSIVNAIKDAQKSDKAIDNYYYQYQLSLDGGENSEAYKDTKVINDAFKKVDAGSFTAADRKVVEDTFGTSKFFLVYVESSCENCAKSKGGFSVLENRWNTTASTEAFYAKDAMDFKIVTIFIDEITSESTSTKTAFQQYFEVYSDFFELANEAAQNTAYFDNGGVTESDLEVFVNPDPFLAPAILLIDFSDTKVTVQQGVSEVTFGAKGDSDYDRAEFLLDCWNHEGEFKYE